MKCVAFSAVCCLLSFKMNNLLILTVMTVVVQICFYSTVLYTIYYIYMREKETDSISRAVSSDLCHKALM